VRVPTHRTLPAHDDDGVRFQPILHLREGMPNVFVVQLGQRMHAEKLGNGSPNREP